MKIPLQWKLMAWAAQNAPEWGGLDDGDASGMEAREGGNEVPSQSDDSPTPKGDAQKGDIA